MNTKNVVLSFLASSNENAQLKVAMKNMEKQAMDFSSISPLLEPGNLLNERELVRAVRLSISAEEDAASLYELIADSTFKNKDIKKIFQDVANEERVHIGEFQKILSILDKEETKFLEDGAKEVEEKL